MPMSQNFEPEIKFRTYFRAKYQILRGYSLLEETKFHATNQIDLILDRSLKLRWKIFSKNLERISRIFVQ